MKSADRVWYGGALLVAAGSAILGTSGCLKARHGSDTGVGDIPDNIMKLGYISEISFIVDPENGVIPRSERRNSIYYASVCFTREQAIHSEACLADDDGVEVIYRESGSFLRFTVDWQEGFPGGLVSENEEDRDWLGALVRAMSRDGVVIELLSPEGSTPRRDEHEEYQFSVVVDTPVGINPSSYRAVAYPSLQVSSTMYKYLSYEHLTSSNWLDPDGDIVVSTWEIFPDYHWTR